MACTVGWQALRDGRLCGMTGNLGRNTTWDGSTTEEHSRGTQHGMAAQQREHPSTRIGGRVG
eukprot:42797-Chlamydomonas_euryale.AAC.4